MAGNWTVGESVRLPEGRTIAGGSTVGERLTVDEEDRWEGCCGLKSQAAALVGFECDFADAQAEQRALRPELDAGIGGSTRPGSLKCLHAHAAFALARPGYELGDRILAELPSMWPESCCTPD